MHGVLFTWEVHLELSATDTATKRHRHEARAVKNMSLNACCTKSGTFALAGLL